MVDEANPRGCQQEKSKGDDQSIVGQEGHFFNSPRRNREKGKDKCK